MKNWYAVFEDDVQNPVTVEENLNSLGLKRFEKAAKAGSIGGRKVYGMWVTDHVSEQAYTIKRHGRVPGQVDALHKAWQDKKKS